MRKMPNWMNRDSHQRIGIKSLMCGINIRNWLRMQIQCWLKEEIDRMGGKCKILLLKFLKKKDKRTKVSSCMAVIFESTFWCIHGVFKGHCSFCKFFETTFSTLSIAILTMMIFMVYLVFWLRSAEIDENFWCFDRDVRHTHLKKGLRVPPIWCRQRSSENMAQTVQLGT